MSQVITVNGLDITSGAYIVEEATYHQQPVRDIKTTGVSRRSATKKTALEWKSKDIIIKGRVFSTSYSGLLNAVDTLQQNFAVQNLALQLDTNRTYTADLTKMEMPSQFYNLTMIQYNATFTAFDPFAYAPQILASGTVNSGPAPTISGSLTISGTVYALPQLSIYPKGASNGVAPIYGLQVQYTPTGELLTVSGIFNYASPVLIDYFNFQVTNGGNAQDYTGIFSRFGPGQINYVITLTSGTGGFNYVWAYQPRYYQ